MPLRACPKCQHRFYQIMDDDAISDNKSSSGHNTSKNHNSQEHFVMCSSCGTLLGTFREIQES